MNSRVQTEIFEGITYGCKRLDATEEGSGLVHWAIVDLAAPGIELYVTPLDPVAVAGGGNTVCAESEMSLTRSTWQSPSTGRYSTSNSGWWPRMAGDLARGVETVVADQIVSHLWEHTYLLWFDDQLMPHLRPSKPPTAAELAQAKWGIGGQGSVVAGMARFGPGSSRIPIRELRWPSIGTANSCFWPSAKTFRRDSASGTRRSRGQGRDAS